MLDRTQRLVYQSLVAAFFLGAGWLVAGCNPFAPGLSDIVIDRNALLGDRRSVDGLFKYFRNTYELRDSLLYGRMLARDFRFVYFDFANNNQTFWGRDQEMMTTYNMFRRTRQVTLIWNNYVYADTTLSDTLASVERYFNLTIVQDDATIYRGTGSARLILSRPERSSPWFIKEWFDKSDF